MFQNLDTWLVLLSLTVTIVALAAWIKDAGDDWLRRNEAGNDVSASASERRTMRRPAAGAQTLGKRQQAGA